MIEVDDALTKTTPENRRICGHFVGPAGYPNSYIEEHGWRWTIYLSIGVARLHDADWQRAFPMDAARRRELEEVR